MTQALADAVRRALARDTMLRLAHDAEQALVIVRKDDHKARVFDNEEALLRIAVERYLVEATTRREWTGQVDHDWSFRSDGNANAATILRFCAYLGHPLAATPAVEELYETALAEIRPADGPVRDRWTEVTVTYRLIRSLRASGRPADGLALAAALDREFFFASGAEPCAGDVDFETGACLLELGQAAEVHSALGELAQTYWESTEASSYSTRHRYGFILALADQAAGDTDEAVTRMTAALAHLEEFRIADPQHDVYELSLALTLAELLALTGHGNDRAVRLAGRALTVAEGIRSRWGVISRARTPLSTAFRRVYGDIALLAAALPGPAAAELGLRMCLAAKQTGLAAQMRAEVSLLPNQLQGLIDDVLKVERDDPLDHRADARAVQAQREEQNREIDTLHRRIEKRVNPIFAEMTLPTPTDLTTLRRALDGRYALDFAALPDSLATGTNWFRALITPDDGVFFERFTPGAQLAAYVAGRRARDPQAPIDLDLGDPDWHRLALDLLPAELRGRLDAVAGEPLELVISAHQELCLVPWAALVLDSGGTRLLRRAVLTHTPVLTCLSGSPPPVVTGPALVRLVPLAHDGPSDNLERRAWNLNRGDVPLSRCPFDDQEPTAHASPRISVALRRGTECGLLHVKAHGTGHGLGQHLILPEETDTGAQLSAAYALALRWPASTLMVSCQVGAVTNVADIEPVGLVVAVLAGGGRSVAAAIEEVAKLPASRMAAHLVGLVRRSGIRLDHALRLAQLHYLRLGEPVANWALFNAYVR
ncbi:CHAT domain-containing protein [Micromonospora sp. RP3T]|uniref:CHAT domain-containing protein n=1 Tax=Micromonospora sp. RP3T TaxID=2135446 RepID=UPI003D7073E2